MAVLACDPLSPLSGGALLGDRFRMPARSNDDGIFIRSLAAAAGHGALAEHLRLLIRILESFGFEVILIETVGAGQADTAVRDLADVVVLLLQPEMGDDIQWQKAGLLEVADVIVIHKADLPQAEQLEAEVRSMLALSPGRAVPILRVSARTGEGMEALWMAIAGHKLHRAELRKENPELLRLAQDLLERWYSAAQSEKHPGLPEIQSRLQDGILSDSGAAEELVEFLQKEYGPKRKDSEAS